MASKVSLSRLIGFNDFFPNEVPESKEAYVQKMGKEFLFKFSCHFLSYFKFNAVPSNGDLLKEWFTYNEFEYHQSPSYYVVLEGYQRIFIEGPGQRVEILCFESFLKLFTWLSLQKDIPEIVEESDASLTLPLFKLLLLFNDEILVYALVRVFTNHSAKLKNHLLQGCRIAAAPQRSPPTLKAMVGKAQVQRKAGT